MKMTINVPFEPTDKIFVVIGNDIKELIVDEIRITVKQFPVHNYELDKYELET